MHKVTAGEFAQICGKSSAWVSKQIANGMPVRSLGDTGEAHEIDSAAAIGWLRKRANPEQTESARLRRAQASKAEFENSVREGEYIPADQHDSVIGLIVTEVAQQMSAMPGRLAGELASMTEPAQIRARLKDECDAVRNAVGKHLEEIADVMGALADDEIAAAIGKGFDALVHRVLSLRTSKPATCGAED